MTSSLFNDGKLLTDILKEVFSHIRHSLNVQALFTVCKSWHRAALSHYKEAVQYKVHETEL
jgi:hypothetical protein